MTNPKNDIREIIRKYIAGNYTPEELDELLSYMQQNDRRHFDEQSLAFWNGLMQQEHAQSAEERVRYQLEALRITRKPGGAAKVRARSLWGHSRHIAASVILVIGFTAAIYWLWPERNFGHVPAATYLAADVKRGDKREMVLADGSSVFLNAESQLVYPEEFGNQREVQLKGEAFFKVMPDSLHAFLVKTANLTVKVLGTSFNIKNYDTDPSLSVTVTTGKVMVDLGGNTIRLYPNEQLYINKQTGEFEKRVVPASKYTQWREGLLYFNRTPFPEVIETLERWYGTNIHLSGDYPGMISGEHDNKSLTAVLEAICFTTGMKYKKNTDGFLLYKN